VREESERERGCERGEQERKRCEVRAPTKGWEFTLRVVLREGASVDRLKKGAAHSFSMYTRTPMVVLREGVSVDCLKKGAAHSFSMCTDVLYTRTPMVLRK